MRPIEEQGYVIMAINTDSTDYMTCAVRLADSIKQHNSDARVCVISNVEVHHQLFDHVIHLAADTVNPYANDPLAFRLSPFRETIKLEADMLIASSIDHWWDMLDIVILC